MEYDPTQFRGTAPFYLRGRPPYSAELAEVIQRELQLDGRGRLLDVGSGPGMVGMQLAPLFEQVIFVEPDPDMLTEARAHAASALLSAVEFHRATAENLGSVITAPARVAAFGQSFHRTDRARAAQTVYDILEPGGSIVLITHNPNRPPPPQPADTSLIPHDEIRQLVRQTSGRNCDQARGRPPSTAPNDSSRRWLGPPSVHPVSCSRPGDPTSSEMPTV